MIGKRLFLAVIIFVLLFVLLFIFADPVQSFDQTSHEVTLTTVGRVVNTQGSAVEEAEVKVIAESDRSATKFSMNSSRPPGLRVLSVSPI